MSDEPRDDETAGAPSSRVLTSGGAMEAQAYATANLRDAVRPTLEMDKVQITDPRNAITSRKKRPPIPDLPAVTPAPPPVASEGPVSTRGTGVLPPPSAPPRRLAPPPMPGATPPSMPVTPPPLPVTPSRASDDDEGADRPTLPRDDHGERITLPTARKSPFATPPGGVTSPPSAPAEPRSRSTLLLGIVAAAVIGLGGAWFALASRPPAGAATTAPEVAPIVTVTAGTAAPAPIETAAPVPTAAPTVAAAPRPEGPASPRPAPRPAARPKAPAPPPASTTPAKGRLFGVED